MAARFFDTDEAEELAQIAMRRAAYQQWAATVTPQLAAGATSLAATYPHMRPGTVLSLTKAGISADHPVAQAAAKAEAKRGFGFHSIGDAISGAAAAVGHGIGDVKDAAYSAVKGVSRGLDIGISSIGQTFQGAVRHELAAGDTHGAEWLLALNPVLHGSDLIEGFKQTSLAAAAEGHDTGSGFFSGGEAERVAVARRRAAAPLINGHAATIGRQVASQVAEPGHRSFSLLSGLIDAAVNLGSDPTVVAGAPVKGAMASRRLFAGSKGLEAVRPVDESARSAAGLLDGSIRPTVLPDRAAQWLDSRQGRQVRSYLADETDFVRLRRQLGDNVPVELLPALLDARTDREVLDVLGPELGVSVREKFGVSHAAMADVRPDQAGAVALAGARVVRLLDGVRAYRIFSKMPGSHVNLDDPQQAVEQIERFGRNVKMDDARTGVFAERMARASDRNTRYTVVRDFLRTVQDDVLKERNVPADVRRRLTTINPNHDERLRVYAIDDVGDNARVPGAVVNGDLKPAPTPHYFNEYINSAVPLPDARELRRATSGFVDMLDKVPAHLGTNLLRTGTALGDFINSNIFKVGALFRAAYPLRVVGEEQIRIAASGGTSLVNHPLSHIAAIVAHKKGQSTDLLGNPIKGLDDLSAALSRNAALGIERTGVVRARGRTVLRRGDEGFAHALLDELAKGANDPVQRRVLNGLGEGDVHPNVNLGGIDAVKDWFYEGSGRLFREQMRHGDGREFFDVKRAADGSIDSADGYIDSMMDRAKTVTGGDNVLLEAMATGRIGGEPLTVVAQGGARKANPKALAALEQHLASGAGPQVTPADLMLHAKGTAGSALGEKYNAFVDQMFDKLMGVPTDTLSRAPLFEQAYWRRQAELVEFMHPDVRAAALAAAEQNKSAAPFLKQMRRRAASGVDGQLTAAEADTLAKAYAVESTKKLLYDLSNRSQWSDIYRLFFPFGSAWAEVLNTWTRIATKENPLVVHRAAQLVTAGRNADTNGDGQGFFHHDEATGQEMFSYPFSGWISQKLTGVPAPMKASVTGLNLFSSSVLPGFGPVITVPAGKLLPDRPQWDGVRGVLLPFGEKDMSGGVLESFLPPWVQKARTWLDMDSPAQDRAYANTVLDVTRYLTSTGRYTTSTPEGQAKLLEDAKAKARSIYGIRALAQFFAPSAPSPEFVVNDKTGRALTALKLSEAYRKMLEEDPATATQQFLDQFGEGAFLATIPKSQGGGPPTDVAWQFMRENPDTVAAHRDVFGLFLPQTGAFSHAAYEAQLRTGARKPMTPEEALQLANQRIGAMVYREARSRVGDNVTRSERAWLGTVRDAIEQEYPGYSPMPSTVGATDRTITKLVAAAKDPVLARTDAGRGLTEYLQARSDAVDLARERGLTTFTRAKAAADIRAGLRRIADQLAAEHPDFGEMFDRTLNREMVADEPEGATA